MLDDAVELVAERVEDRDGRLVEAGAVGGPSLQGVRPRAGGAPRELPQLPGSLPAGSLSAGAARGRPLPAPAAVGADLGAGEGAVERPGPAGEQVVPACGQPRVPAELEGAPDRLGGDERSAGRVVRA